MPPALPAYTCVENAAVVKVSVLTARFRTVLAAEMAESQKCTARESGTHRPRPIHGSKAEISSFLLVPPVPSAHNCVANATVVKVSVLTARFCALRLATCHGHAHAGFDLICTGIPYGFENAMLWELESPLGKRLWSCSASVAPLASLLTSRVYS